MAHEWFPSETSKSGLSDLPWSPLFPALSWIFPLDSSTNNLSRLSSPSCPQFTFQLSSSLNSSLIFQMARPTLGASNIEFYLLFSTSSWDLYLYFYCHHSLIFILIHWVCSSNIWMLVDFTPSIFSLEFFGDPLCLMNQVQILYLDILNLSFYL